MKNSLTGRNLRGLKIILTIASICLISFELFTEIPLARQVSRKETYSSIEQSSEALKKNPSDPAALRGMALQMSVRHKLPASIFYLRKVVAVEPENTHDKFLLSAALAHDGQIDEARRLMEELASTDNPEKEIAQAILRKTKSKQK